MPPTSPLDDWLQRIPDPVAIAHGVTLKDIRFTRWNAAFGRLLGLPDDERSQESIRAALAEAGLFDPQRTALCPCQQPGAA